MTLRPLAEEYLIIKEKRLAKQKELDYIVEEERELKKHILQQMEIYSVERIYTEEKQFEIEQEQFAVLPKEDADREVLFDFLRQNGLKDKIGVNSRDLQTLTKKFQKIEEDKLGIACPNYVLPGCPPRANQKKLKVSKI